MINPYDSCGTPQENLQFESTSCYYAQGRDIKNVIGIGTGGYSLSKGKFADIIGLYNVNSGDTSINLNLDTVNRILEFAVAISATAGNTITLNPDGLYSAGGGGGSVDILSPLLLMGG